jgi:hypothetical protein
MKRFSIVAFILLSISSAAFAQNSSDSCHVYLADTKAAQKAYETLTPNSSQEAVAKALASAMKILGVFPTVVGEERLTTKSFPFPDSKLVITASVFYTDESMAADSITLGIVISNKEEKNAIAAPNNAVSEVNYDGNTKIVRVRKYADVNGRNFLVGLQCDIKKQAGTK